MKEIVIDGTTYVPKSETVNNTEGLTYCIVRTYSAGVWAGYTDFSVNTEGRYVKQAIRMWKWHSKFTLSEIAIHGVNDASECKFAEPVPVVGLSNVIEVIPCSSAAFKSLTTVSTL